MGDPSAVRGARGRGGDYAQGARGGPGRAAARPAEFSALFVGVLVSGLGALSRHPDPSLSLRPERETGLPLESIALVGHLPGA